MLSLRPRKFCTICSSSTVPLFFQHFAAEFQARLRIKHAVLSNSPKKSCAMTSDHKYPVIARVIPAHNMPERRLRIGAFGQRQAADFFGQGKIGFRGVGGFGSGVQLHVILRKKSWRKYVPPAPKFLAAIIFSIISSGNGSPVL